jgi:glucose-1-phosphate adenylyltransferase
MVPGTADAVQQNFRFIKSGAPDQVLILSGDHIYGMNYDATIAYRDHAGHDYGDDPCPMEKRRASVSLCGRSAGQNVCRETLQPPPIWPIWACMCSTWRVGSRLWEDHQNDTSSHDFGKDILPRLVALGRRVLAYPYTGYWVDVGTVDTYWRLMDLLTEKPPIDLNDRSGSSTPTEASPAWIARARRSWKRYGWLRHLRRRLCRAQRALPAWRHRRGGPRIDHVTDCVVKAGAIVERAIVNKRAEIGENARIER